MKKKIVLSMVFFVVYNLTYSQVVNFGTVVVKDNSVMTCGEYDLLNKNTSSIINDGDIHLQRNLENDGEVSFVNDNGVFHFKGSSDQNILTGLLGTTDFQHVNFETLNQASINVVNTFTINRNAYFNSGIINNTAINSEILFKELGESYYMSDASYINGKVLKKGDNFFTFPVGAKSTNLFRPFYIKSNLQSELIQNEYYLENSDFQYPHSNKANDVVYVNEIEFWEIVNTDENQIMEAGLLVNNSYLSPNILNHLYGTVKAIIYYDLNSNQWINKGGVLNQTTNVIYNSSLNLQTGPYTIGRVKSKEQEDLDLFIYNAISPNGNNQNDYLKITGVENYPDNSLEVFNRYGHPIYTTKNYGINDNLWYGTHKDKKLPTGTYFYIFKFIIENGSQVEKTGYVYIN